MKFLTSLALLLIATGALAKGPLPTLELGAGISAFSLPDYRGSENSSTYVLPVPYIKYRSKRLRLDGGAKGIFFESEDVLFTLSADLTLSSDDDSDDRKGMDDLDTILEIGPALNYRFYPMQNSGLWADLPQPVGYTVNTDVEHIGYVSAPTHHVRQPDARSCASKLRVNL